MQALVEECEVSERTIYRDLLDLKNANYPVRFNEVGRKYYVDDKKFNLRMLSFSDDEAVALLQCINAFSQQEIPFYGAISIAKEKLEMCLPAEKRAIIQQKMGVVEIAMQDPTELSDSIFNPLAKSALEYKSVMISYCSSSGQSTQRKVNPYGLIFKQSAWYLVAYCHVRKDIRLFRSDRIFSVEILDESFTVEEGFCLQEFFDQSWAVGQGPEVHVLLKISPEIASNFKKVKYHRNQKIIEQLDGSVLYEVTVRGMWEISRWILSFGPTVEILEPKELRKYVIDMVAGMNKLYKL